MTLNPQTITDEERERRDTQRHDAEIARASCNSPLNPFWHDEPDCDRIYIDPMFRAPQAKGTTQ